MKPEFKFFLIRENSKIPYELKWNSDNNYHFFDPKLMKHNGNYGICTGPGNLIIIDFDDTKYYNSVSSKLPPTFTVLSAGKRLPHMYYLLDGEMFKKIAIKGKDKNVLCDIQADRCGIVGPGSTIERKFYAVVNNRAIANIGLEQLRAVFNINPTQKREYTGDNQDNPELVQKTIKILLKFGVQRTANTNFKCPFHPSINGNSLSILPNGNLYCFHETKHWFLDNFIKDMEAKNGRVN